MPKLQQLRYLVALADTLSFSRAAALCHVSQPTLSMQLKEMEERLGCPLVERTRARVLLTPMGAAVARKARMVLAEIEDIRAMARRGDPEAGPGTLELGVVQTVGAYVLSVAMPALRAAFPDLAIHVREDREPALLARLADGTHDALLLPAPPERGGFVSAPLIREPLHLVLPSSHRLAAQARIEPRDLAGETVLSMGREAGTDDQTARLCREVGARHASDYEGTTLDTLRQMVAVGMGISLLPALYVRSEVMREAAVVARPLSHGAPERRLCLVWRAQSPRAAGHAALAALIRDSLAPWAAPEGPIAG